MTYKLRKSMIFALAFTLTLAAVFCTGCGPSTEKHLKKGKEAYESKDYDTAFNHFEAAAKKDNPEAQYMLGICYSKGRGVEQDKEEGLKWYQKAADQDFAKAQLALATLYHDGGRGFEKDEDNAESLATKAVPGLKKEAKAGDELAQLLLGGCYLGGLGVEKDEEEGVKWVRKAANQDLAKAQALLGACYMAGKGVEEDEIEAVKWFRKAANQDLAEAQIQLAICYYNGEGVEKDLKEAKKWIEKAAKQGNDRAKSMLESLESELEED